jgi:putative phosphoribosyl transferase
VDATNWIKTQGNTETLPIGYFVQARMPLQRLSRPPNLVTRLPAVVSRGGRPDLAGAWLPEVKASTLLVVVGRTQTRR